MKTIVFKDGINLVNSNVSIPNVVGTAQISVDKYGGVNFNVDTTGKLLGINVINNTGSGYTIGDILTVTGGSGNAATLIVVSTDINGGIGSFSGVNVLDGGDSYDNNGGELGVTGGTGNGFLFTGLVASGGISVNGAGAYNDLSGVTNVGTLVCNTLNNVVWPNYTNEVNSYLGIDGAGNASWSPKTDFNNDIIVKYNATSSIPELAYTITDLFDPDTLTNYSVVTVIITAQATNTSISTQVYSTIYHATFKMVGNPEIVGGFEVINELRNDIVVQAGTGETWNIYVSGPLNQRALEVYVKGSEYNSTSSWKMKIEVIGSYYNFV